MSVRCLEHGHEYERMCCCAFLLSSGTECVDQ